MFSARKLQQGIAVRRERAAIMYGAMRGNYSDEGEKRNCLSCPRGHLQHAVLLSIERSLRETRMEASMANSSFQFSDSDFATGRKVRKVWS